MRLRYTVVVAFIENTTLGMSMAAFFKRGFRKYLKKKKKKKKSDGSIAAFLKRSLSPTHKNAAQTSKNAFIELIFRLRLPNAAQSQSTAAFL